MLGAALVSAGIPKDSVIKYETALKADKFVVIAHGTREEVERAKTILNTNQAETADFHGALVGAGAAK